MKNFNYLVLGSGIAGLTYAIKMAMAKPKAKIAIVTKSILLETNTRYAQGGIAVVSDYEHDTFEAHINDTLKAGEFVNRRNIVEMVVRDAPERIMELINWGAKFDKSKNGNLNLNLEGGHTARRIIHHKDRTGFHLENILIAKCRELDNVYIFENHFAVDLLMKHDTCCGAEILNMQNLQNECIVAGAVVLATGGAGQMYEFTTNPVISTGDGVAMASRAGAEISNMHFVQFHPTALFEHAQEPAFLISEAVRGFGAVLRNNEKEDFMMKYDSRGSLATRDIVARSIFYEMNIKDCSNVWLDCHNLDLNKFKVLFPSIYKKCQEINIDLKNGMIPVAPAAHYICGGITTDEFGTTTVKNLYAIGECANTGLHGSNRLASNSLLEALVFAHKAYLHSLETEVNFSYFKTKTDVMDDKKTDKTVIRYRKKMKREMMRKAGIVKTTFDMQVLKEEIELIEETLNIFNKQSVTIQFLELKNLLSNCLYVVNHSLQANKNTGTFFNSDLVRRQISV